MAATGTACKSFFWVNGVASSIGLLGVVNVWFYGFHEQDLIDYAIDANGMRQV